jgi:hypothetical protein
MLPFDSGTDYVCLRSPPGWDLFFREQVPRRGERPMDALLRPAGSIEATI